VTYAVLITSKFITVLALQGHTRPRPELHAKTNVRTSKAVTFKAKAKILIRKATVEV